VGDRSINDEVVINLDLGKIVTASEYSIDKLYEALGMISPQTKPTSFADFLEWYPDDEQRYELIEGVIVEMLPTGSHEDIAGFLVAELNLEIRRQNLPYSIPKNCLLKPLAPRSGYLPDVAVINREYIKNELLWQKSSVIQDGQTVPLVIEVVLKDTLNAISASRFAYQY
jgi:Uma2 family endonuclease